MAPRPRKNVGGLLDAYERLLARAASNQGSADAGRYRTPDLVLAGKATADAQKLRSNPGLF